MAFLTDSFTAANGTVLRSHTGETGATWTKGSVYTGGWLITANRAYGGSASQQYILDVASATPASADYDVNAVMHYFTPIGGYVGICGRVQSPNPTSINLDCYMGAVQNGVFQLRKQTGQPSVVSNPGTIMGTYAPGLVAGQDYTVKLMLRGTQISLWVDGVKRIQVADSTFTTPGRIGVSNYSSMGTTAGVHLDSISGVDPPPIGQFNYLTNTGDWTALPYTVKEGASWVPPSSVTAF